MDSTTKMNVLPLSVSIISFNEEPNIGRLLDIVSGFAAEIIVVDSHSTDATREIAQARGAQVFTEEYKGPEGQKQSALDKCTQSWVMMIDCDEVPDDAMQQAIKDVVSADAAGAYVVRRRTIYMNRELRYAWQPDVHLRLVH